MLSLRATPELLEECDTPLDGTIECDESTFGGHRKDKRGWGAAGKTLVFGIYKRNGIVCIFAVDNRKQATLLPLIEKHMAQGCLYYTDDYSAYASLRVCGEHVIVNKEKGRPKGRDHINEIGVTRKIGCIHIVVCPKSLGIFIWLKLRIVSNIAKKTFIPYCIRR